MATLKVGYNAAGQALDYTTHNLAWDAAQDGDSIETYYATNTRSTNFYEGARNFTDIGLTHTGMT
ncbi:MAG: hypothetical protein N3A66_04400, partial [Planctomycetota bacterium]|nr:hypothetical protein [Planctomycetota bacterium]